MITINQLESYFNSLNSQNRLVILDEEDYMVASFFRAKITNAIRYYINIVCDETFDYFINHRLNNFDNPRDDTNHIIKIISYDEWLTYAKKTINRNVQRALSENNHIIQKLVDEIDNNKWKYVSFHDNKKVLLIGVTSTDEDLYYLYIDKDLSIEFACCNIKYSVIEDDNDNDDNDYSVLDYLIKYDKISLIEKVEQNLAKLPDVLITSL